MTDEFLIKGLEDDRYLKALRLADQFEDEIEAKLQQIAENMIEENPELFDTGIEGDKKTKNNPKNTIAFSRIDYPMARKKSEEDDTNLKLNVHLYWVDPTEYNRTDIDGTLRGLGYKIKDALKENEDYVAKRTRDMTINAATSPWGTRTVFYKHVSPGAELPEAADMLVDHFSKFGTEFGFSPND